MKLNIMERLLALGILPKESNFVTLKIVRDLQGTLSLNEEEMKEFEVEQAGTDIKWNDKGKEARELQIGEKATDIIIEALEKLNKDNKLTAQYMSLYEKFINGKEN